MRYCCHFFILIIFGGILSCSSIDAEKNTPSDETIDENLIIFSEKGLSRQDILDVKRGKYLFDSVGACGYCHFQSKPWTFAEDNKTIAPNIIASTGANLRSWSREETLNALRLGATKNGDEFTNDSHKGFQWMSNKDARAIVDYLKFGSDLASNKLTLIEAEKDEASSFLGFHREPRVTDIDPGYIPSIPESPTKEYGRYLTLSVARCQNCHSPEGERSGEELLAGGTKPKGFFDIFSDSSDAKSKLTKSKLYPTPGPDIRGSSDLGLKSWTTEDIITYLSSGNTPTQKTDNDNPCPWEYYRHMNDNDKLAIALFLKSI